ncbi:MAG: DUF5615 family PIN-like protein [Actinobacteria bacterium]|nr:DUF5615 family PIN-like protein [Actinomycetota bacterium]
MPVATAGRDAERQGPRGGPCGLLRHGDAPDPEVLARADAEDRAVLSADTDFGMILGQSRASRPSVILLRLETDRRVEDLADLIEANRATIEAAVEEGSIIVIGDALVRVRSLPIL